MTAGERPKSVEQGGFRRELEGNRHSDHNCGRNNTVPQGPQEEREAQGGDDGLWGRDGADVADHPPVPEQCNEELQFGAKHQAAIVIVIVALGEHVRGDLEGEDGVADVASMSGEEGVDVLGEESSLVEQGER